MGYCHDLGHVDEIIKFLMASVLTVLESECISERIQECSIAVLFLYKTEGRRERDTKGGRRGRRGRV